jgi:hypothetical protein
MKEELFTPGEFTYRKVVSNLATGYIIERNDCIVATVHEEDFETGDEALQFTIRAVESKNMYEALKSIIHSYDAGMGAKPKQLRVDIAKEIINRINNKSICKTNGLS